PAEEAQESTDLGPGHPGPDGPRQPPRGTPTLLHPPQQRRADPAERLDVGADPAGTVDDQHRRGVRWRVQTGELPHQARPARGALAQLGHRVRPPLATDTPPPARDPRADLHGEVPIDHVGGVHGANLRGAPTPGVRVRSSQAPQKSPHMWRCWRFRHEFGGVSPEVTTYVVTSPPSLSAAAATG